MSGRSRVNEADCAVSRVPEGLKSETPDEASPGVSDPKRVAGSGSPPRLARSSSRGAPLCGEPAGGRPTSCDGPALVRPGGRRLGLAAAPAPEAPRWVLRFFFGGIFLARRRRKNILTFFFM